ITVSSYPFDYENDVEALKRLYNQHNLSAIVKDDQPELDTLMALMIYTNEFLAGGTPPAKNTWMTTTWPSAEIITKLRREKGIGGTSEHYAALFCQLSLSCGFDARLVSMHTLDDTGEPLTHDVCEVFLVSYDKWVVFDPYSRATYYLRDSIPQSALELRNLMFDGLYRDIYPVSGFGDFTDVVSVREKILPRYRYIYIWRMNDMLSKSQSGKPMPWQALYQVHLVWEDEKTLVADGGFEKLDKFNNTDNPEYPLNGVRYVTHNKSDFYWNLNRVVLNLERTGDFRLNMYIDTIAPNFDYFEIENVGDVYKYKKNIFELTIDFSEIYVRSFNKLGRCGVMSKLILMWD
ncbi:MAG TPA: transglutaminase domain-containing protein, partial [Anaerolineae bacterium]|nr:transglutaminase domain-containing protein [Anaerolineae bacterium]